MRFRHFIGLSVFLVCAFGDAHAQSKSPAAPAESLAMKPGLWETSQLVETTGSNTRRTVTSRACLSAEDVKSAARVLPQQHEAPMKCENRDAKVKGDAVAWRIVCTGQGESAVGSGEMTVAADSFKAQAKLDAKAGGKSRKIQQTIAGKWVSADCK